MWRFFALAASSMLIGLMAGCDDKSGRPGSMARPDVAEHSWPLVIDPEPISLGIVTAKRPMTVRAMVFNPTNTSKVVASASTSCPCLGLEGLPVSIGPMESRHIVIRFDPTSEPDFRGSLSVGLEGRAVDGMVLFQTRVNLEVRQHAEAYAPGSIDPPSKHSTTPSPTADDFPSEHTT